MAAPPSRISPTAHYTGYVWSRNGLSPPRFATTRGAAMFHALEGPMRLAAATTGGLTLERMLLQRHLVIDCDLGLGDGTFTVLTNDLTHEYIDENTGGS